MDSTLDIIERDEDIQSYLLAWLKDNYNKHLISNVLCPWGWSDYNHK